MSQLHSIRLRGPWEWQTLGEPAHTGRAEAPGERPAALPADFHGCLRYTRRFNAPTNLAGERVWLVLDGPLAPSHVELNHQVVGPLDGYGPSERMEITALLSPHNVLAVEMAPAEPERWLAVRLEMGRE